MSWDTFQGYLNATGGLWFPQGGAFRLGLRDEQELAGGEAGNVFLLDIILCAKAQRPESRHSGGSETSPPRLQQAGVEVASERRGWGGKGEPRAKEGF